eukprot:gene9509-13215_t
MAQGVSGEIFWERAGELADVIPAGAKSLVIEFANTIIAITADRCWVLAGKKACADTLLPLKTAPAGKKCALLQCQPKKDENAAHLSKVLTALKERELGGIAAITGDLRHMRGEFFAQAFVRDLGDTVDMTAATTELLRVKDAVERDTIKKAGAFISTVWNRVAMKKITQMIQNETKKKEVEFAEEIVKVIEEPQESKVKGLNVAPDDITLAAIEPSI